MDKEHYDIEKIAKHIDAKIFNPRSLDLQQPITELSPLPEAGKGHITFLTNPRYLAEVGSSRASALITKTPLPSAPMVQLLHPEPHVAMALAAQLFYQPTHSFQGQSPLAYLDHTAEIHPSVTIYPFAYIGPGAKIGKNCVIYPHTYIGEFCQIGENSVFFPGVILMDHCQIGNNVVIHGGAVLGADGFGFAPTKDKLHKIPQLGHVVLEDEVEIGPLNSIDRATFNQTIIRRGSKLDSQVHVGHNVDVGEMSMLCGQVGIAGSSKLGKHFIAAGQAGVSNGLTVGDHVVLGARAAMLQSQEQAGEYMGTPAIPAALWKRQAVALKKLPDLLKQIKKLEERLAALEQA